jgi:hypothetical protein
MILRYKRAKFTDFVSYFTPMSGSCSEKLGKMPTISLDNFLSVSSGIGISPNKAGAAMTSVGQQYAESSSVFRSQKVRVECLEKECGALYHIRC